MAVFIALLIFLGGAIVLIVRIRSSKAKYYNRLFTKTANKLNLNFEKSRAGINPKITGDLGGCEINVSLISGYRVMISCRGFAKINGFFRIYTYANELPKRMRMETDPPYLLTALMNKEIRDKLAILLLQSESFRISNQYFNLVTDSYNSTGSAQIILLIDEMVAILQNLLAETPIKDRLLLNMRKDPDMEYRIKSLRALTTHFLGNNDTFEALNQALQDPKPVVQFEASLFLGTKGLKHMIGMLKFQINQMNPDLQSKIIKLLHKNEFKESIPVLKKTFLTTNNENIKILILKTLKSFADDRLNRFLLTQIKSGTSRLIPAIVDALATCGRVDAVEELVRLGKTTLNPFLRSLVKEAILKIQSRLGDVEKGWVSISELDGLDGALSMGQPTIQGSLSLDKKIIKGKNEK